MFAWQFNRVSPRFKNREATQGEFFTNDTELRGFIREAIQNSLDARRPRVRSAVRVRIFVSGTQGALTPDRSSRYLDSGWKHFQAEGSGLKNPPDPDEGCAFLTYEDRNTTGLTGDVSQFHEIPGVRNPFYYFFRAEGQSNKSEGGRGRWGLGKFVFPRSSRIRSFFAVTVRHDDGQRLLIGQSILRSHHIKGVSYTPDGWFGKPPERNAACLPVTDQRLINVFCRDFCVTRGSDPGLSLVVPYCDDRWTPQAVTEAVMQDYFAPILRGDLIVTVDAPGHSTVIDAASVTEILPRCAPAVSRQLEPLIALSRWALHSPPSEQVFLPAPTSGESWNRNLSCARTMQILKQKWKDSGRVNIRIPVSIQTKDGQSTESCFSAFISRAEGSLQKHPMFIRDGIVISDVRTRAIRDVHSIVTVDDKPLSVLLGDAENPAHTEWSEESSHFKGKYCNGCSVIRLVRNSVADLCHVLSDSADDADPVLLVDVFSLGTGNLTSGVPVSFPAMSSRSQQKGDRLRRLNAGPTRRKPFSLSNRRGGFRISGRRGASETCPPIEVLLAFDRRNGNPLKKFTTTDFDLRDHSISVAKKNVLIQISSANRLLIFPQCAEFELTLTGFDQNRDLYVKTNVHKPESVALVRAA